MLNIQALLLTHNHQCSVCVCVHVCVVGQRRSLRVERAVKDAARCLQLTTGAAASVPGCRRADWRKTERMIYNEKQCGSSLLISYPPPSPSPNAVHPLIPHAPSSTRQDVRSVITAVISISLDTLDDCFRLSCADFSTFTKVLLSSTSLLPGRFWGLMQCVFFIPLFKKKKSNRSPLIFFDQQFIYLFYCSDSFMFGVSWSLIAFTDVRVRTFGVCVCVFVCITYTCVCVCTCLWCRSQGL